ncbi:MAG: dihydrodipicolinate synthase family protein [Actinomycetota bacterium]
MSLHGAIAAAVTPLTEGGHVIDEEAVPKLLAFLAEGGLDGALLGGTTGEGILLSADERCRLTELALDGRPAGFQIAVHAGAQTTADTVAISAHARERGADAVAVIGPPYFALDEEELFRHFRSAADACSPVPFYVYEFQARTGYAVPVSVVKRLREHAPNLHGMKVSDRPIEAVEPYLGLDGLDVFIGSEPLVLADGARAIGAVSALASAFPDLVARLVHERMPRRTSVEAIRAAMGSTSTPAWAVKAMLVARGVLTGDALRSRRCVP